MSDVRNLREKAAEMAAPALDVLGGLMADSQTVGTVRLSAAKALLDYFLRLEDKASGGDLDALDKYLADFAESVEEVIPE